MQTANNNEINAFMDKYIYKPYTLGGNIVGVEINFNREFYVSEKIDDANDILSEITELDNQIKAIEL